MLAALLLNPRRIGGDDAGGLTRRELRHEEEQAREQIRDKTRAKKVETEKIAAIALAQTQKDLAQAILQNDEAMVLILDDKLRREVVRLWVQE